MCTFAQTTLRHRPEEATILLNDSNKVIISDTELLRTIKDGFEESKCLIVLVWPSYFWSVGREQAEEQQQHLES